MLGSKDAIATVAVKSVAAARKFYEGTLGLKLVHSEQETAHTYKAGNTSVLVYESQFAGTNKATAITWIVGAEVEAIARGLKGKGVVFESYDMPGSKKEGDLYVMGPMKIAWFKDPDGNVIAILNG